jgi:hypothetical protein
MGYRWLGNPESPVLVAPSPCGRSEGRARKGATDTGRPSSGLDVEGCRPAFAKGGRNPHPHSVTGPSWLITVVTAATVTGGVQRLWISTTGHDITSFRAPLRGASFWAHLLVSREVCDIKPLPLPQYEATATFAGRTIGVTAPALLILQKSHLRKQSRRSGSAVPSFTSICCSSTCPPPENLHIL